MSRFIYRTSIIILIVFIPVISTNASGNNKTADSSPVIDVKDNLLTVKVRDIPLKKVLMEIANQIRVKIAFSVSAEEHIGTEFSHFPIVKGLKRLLRGYNYVFIHNPEKQKGGDHEIRKIIITSREGGSQHRKAGPMIVSTEEPSLEPLGEDPYDNNNPHIQEDAEDIPGSIGSEIAIEHLRDALQDANAGIRVSAVGALGVIGGDRAIQALEGALADEDEVVRMLATAELRRLKEEG